MKVKVHVVIESDEGNTETIENIIDLERGTLNPEDLGLTLAEAKSLLKNMQRTIVERQIAQYLEPQGLCNLCGKRGIEKVLTVLYIVRCLVNYGYGVCAFFTVRVSRTLPGASVPWPNYSLNEQHRSYCIWNQSLPP
jgi:hypothetical protein